MYLSHQLAHHKIITSQHPIGVHHILGKLVKDLFNQLCYLLGKFVLLLGGKKLLVVRDAASEGLFDEDVGTVGHLHLVEL
jgi:hypothetical protein